MFSPYFPDSYKDLTRSDAVTRAQADIQSSSHLFIGLFVFLVFYFVVGIAGSFFTISTRVILRSLMMVTNSFFIMGGLMLSFLACYLYLMVSYTTFLIAIIPSVLGKSHATLHCKDQSYGISKLYQSEINVYSLHCSLLYFFQPPYICHSVPEWGLGRARVHNQIEDVNERLLVSVSVGCCHPHRIRGIHFKVSLVLLSLSAKPNWALQ